MADPIEDLEPLFDYSRVQPLDPINLDDDDEDDSNPFPHKKQKLSDGDKLSDVKGVQDVIQINDGEDKDEEDWLPSPVRVPMDPKNREEDSIIKAIRLKKQELLSYARSAEEILQSGEDSGKNDQNTSLQCTAEPLPKPPSERTKIIICIQDKDELKHFRVYMDDKFEKLFKMYADKVKLEIQKLAFSFDGDKISPTATPADLWMEDDDIIEVHVKAS